MEATWFAVIAFMLTTYVVLDGFDFGAGIAHLFVARSDEERRTVIAAIGPVWDGNEVWLVASGGVLVFAFPKAYAVAFSGFYLPLMIVLWLLVGRGLSIELRSHSQNPLWRDFWDGLFCASSVTLALLLGVALANVVRGVPIDASGYFKGELFTNLRTGENPGALDWYTVSIGLFGVAMLGLHGALYLNWKTEGLVQDRSARLARRFYRAALLLGVFVTAGTYAVQPDLFRALAARPAGWLFPLVALGGVVGVPAALGRDRSLAAFLASCAILVGLLGALAAALYPILLRSTIDPAFTVDATRAASSHRGLLLGLIWWIPAMVIALGYFTYLFRSFAGKVKLGDAGHG